MPDQAFTRRSSPLAARLSLLRFEAGPLSSLCLIIVIWLEARWFMTDKTSLFLREVQERRSLLRNSWLSTPITLKPSSLPGDKGGKRLSSTHS